MLSKYSTGNYPGNDPTHNLSVSARPQSSQHTDPVTVDCSVQFSPLTDRVVGEAWERLTRASQKSDTGIETGTGAHDLIVSLKILYLKKAQAGNDFSNISLKPLHLRPPHPFKKEEKKKKATSTSSCRVGR